VERLRATSGVLSWTENANEGYRGHDFKRTGTPLRTMPAMNPGPKRATARRGSPAPGSEVRQRVEALGTSLANALSVVLSALPRRAVGPQRLGEVLGITTVTASRLLKALSQPDPVAMLQLVPGPKPLREVVDAAKKLGVPPTECLRASELIDEFDALIRTYAGDRSALKAMLSAWLPEERREFEAQRRQAIFKALTELEGVSCELTLESIILAPSATPEMLDIIAVKAMLGIDRIRPDAVVKLATRRVLIDEHGQQVALDDGAAPPRTPLNLDGDPAVDGLHTVRLDRFCEAPPAPLDARTFGQYVQYSLGPTGFGPASKVDLVIAEVNRAELPHRAPSRDRPPYMFLIPEMPGRKVVFDLLVDRDVYGGYGPELLTYDTSALGPAVAGDTSRALDLRSVTDTTQVLGSGLTRLRALEFPRYTQLLEFVFERLGLEPGRFRSYRFTQSYPLLGRQITFAFFGPES
jgi:hypothetical protein